MATAPASSPTVSGIDDLKTLVLSFHPLIVIETVEEERVELLLEGLAARMNVTMMEWSVSSGLRLRDAQKSVYGTSDPRQLLSYIAESSGTAIYWLKDFASSLSTPQIVRLLKEVTQGIREAKAITTLIITGADVRLPDDVMPDAAYYQLEMPSEAEYRGVIDGVISSVEWRDGVMIDTSALDREQLCRALSGMTLNQARQAVAGAALDDGRLTDGDLPGIVETKAKTISEGGLLEYFPAEDNKHELGGFDGLKAWLDNARMGFSKEAEAMNLPPPKGILIVGVQGAGKSLAARVIARQWGLPLLKLDAGRIYDSLVGQSEKNFRKATSLAEAMSPDVLWIDEIEKGFAQTRGDADAGLSQRVLGEFLTWLPRRRSAEVWWLATSGRDLSKLPPSCSARQPF